jgi:hypothetical protein
MPKQRTSKPNEDLTVANTILAQLGGGGRLSAMIGATNFLGSANSLQFRFAAPATNGANSVRIVLDASDTYTVEFYKIGHAPKVECTKINSVSFVYDDQLVPVIESETGLRLSLGKVVLV